jgi:hypothetical protein
MSNALSTDLWTPPLAETCAPMNMRIPGVRAASGIASASVSFVFLRRFFFSTCCSRPSDRFPASVCSCARFSAFFGDRVPVIKGRCIDWEAFLSDVRPLVSGASGLCSSACFCSPLLALSLMNPSGPVVAVSPTSHHSKQPLGRDRLSFLRPRFNRIETFEHVAQRAV